MGSYCEKEIMPKSYMDSYRYAEFEGKKNKRPNGYKDYLTKYYGYYMKLPPKHKQVAPHDSTIIWRDKNL